MRRCSEPPHHCYGTSCSTFPDTRCVLPIDESASCGTIETGSLDLLDLAGVSINDAQCDGVEQNCVAAVVTLDLYEWSDGSTGTVITLVELSDLNDGSNAPSGGRVADRAFALALPNSVNAVADKLSLGFVEVHGLSSVVNPIPAFDHIELSD